VRLPEQVDFIQVMLGLMHKQVLMADQVAIYTAQVAQLHRKAEKTNEKLVKRIRKETQTTEEIQRQKRRRIMEEVGLNDENEFEILKQLKRTTPVSFGSICSPECSSR